MIVSSWVDMESGRSWSLETEGGVDTRDKQGFA